MYKKRRDTFKRTKTSGLIQPHTSPGRRKTSLSSINNVATEKVKFSSSVPNRQDTTSSVTSSHSGKQQSLSQSEGV